MMKHMDNELSVEDYAHLQKHLEVCFDCAEDFAAYSGILSDFENMSCLVDAPNGFEKAVMSKIERLEPEESRSRNETVTVALAVGALSILLGLVVLFSGVNLAESVMASLPQFIELTTAVLIQNAHVLFVMVVTLIVAPVVLRRQMASARGKVGMKG